MDRPERIIAVFDLTKEPKKKPRTIVISDSDSDDDVRSSATTTQQSSVPPSISRTEQVNNQREPTVAGSSESTREPETSRQKKSDSATLPVSIETPIRNHPLPNPNVPREPVLFRQSSRGAGSTIQSSSTATVPVTSSEDRPANAVIHTTNVPRGSGPSIQSSITATEPVSSSENRPTERVLFTTNVSRGTCPSTQQEQARRNSLPRTSIRPEVPQTNQESSPVGFRYYNFLPTQFETSTPRIQLNPPHASNKNNLPGPASIANPRFPGNRTPNQSTRQTSNLIEVPTDAFSTPRPTKQRIAHVPKKFAGPNRNPELPKKPQSLNAPVPTVPVSRSSSTEPGSSNRQSVPSPPSAAAETPSGNHQERRPRKQSCNSNEVPVDGSSRPPRKQDSIKSPVRAVPTSPQPTRGQSPKRATIPSSEPELTATRKRRRSRKQSTSSAQSKTTTTDSSANSPVSSPTTSAAEPSTATAAPSTPVPLTSGFEVILESEEYGENMKRIADAYEQFTGLKMTDDKFQQIIKYMEENPELQNIERNQNNNENRVEESEPMEVEPPVETSSASESTKNPESQAANVPRGIKLKISVKDNQFAVIKNAGNNQNPKPNKRGRKKGSKNKKKAPENDENQDVGNQQIVDQSTLSSNQPQPSTFRETSDDQSAPSTSPTNNISDNDTNNCASEEDWEDVEEDQQESLPNKPSKAYIRRSVSKFLDHPMIRSVFVSPIKEVPAPNEVVHDNQISEPAMAETEVSSPAEFEYYQNLSQVVKVDHQQFDNQISEPALEIVDVIEGSPSEEPDEYEEGELMVTKASTSPSYIETLSQVEEVDHRQFVPPLICYICRKQFFTTAMYITHVNRHPDRREFRCECNLFIERHEILDHFDTDHAIGHYQCSCCPFGTIHIKLICLHLLKEHPGNGKMVVLRQNAEDQVFENEVDVETVDELVIRPIVEYDDFWEIVNAGGI